VSEAPAFLASFDIEDWFHAANLRTSIAGRQWDSLENRVERNTHELLDILGEARARSTFFVLGWIARRYPALVRRIVAEGHELASHTDLHKPLSSLPRQEVERELARSRDSLEQLAGAQVLGVRAPNFSISDEVLDCMVEAGYWYDSSFFSLRAHASYGRLAGGIDPDACVVEVRPGLLELPMSRLRIGRLALPWAGGAYFRFIPYGLFRRGVARRLRRDSWFMFYLHPWELDDEEPTPPNLVRLRRVRAYAGRPRVRRDLGRLLAEFGSGRVDETLRSRGFSPPAG
jgi:polysaccharide deacetylase family protein (PEP-CTERM system associated)